MFSNISFNGGRKDVGEKAAALLRKSRQDKKSAQVDILATSQTLSKTRRQHSPFSNLNIEKQCSIISSNVATPFKDSRGRKSSTIDTRNSFNQPITPLSVAKRIHSIECGYESQLKILQKESQEREESDAKLIQALKTDLEAFRGFLSKKDDNICIPKSVPTGDSTCKENTSATTHKLNGIKDVKILKEQNARMRTIIESDQHEKQNLELRCCSLEEKNKSLISKVETANEKFNQMESSHRRIVQDYKKQCGTVENLKNMLQNARQKIKKGKEELEKSLKVSEEYKLTNSILTNEIKDVKHNYTLLELEVRQEFEEYCKEFESSMWEACNRALQESSTREKFVEREVKKRVKDISKSSSMNPNPRDKMRQIESYQLTQRDIALAAKVAQAADNFAFKTTTECAGKKKANPNPNPMGYMEQYIEARSKGEIL